MTRDLAKIVKGLIEVAKSQIKIKGRNVNYIPENDFIDLINGGGKIVYLNKSQNTV